MRNWISEHWFIVRSYLWAALAQIIALYIWDWIVPTTSWGFNLPRFVHWIFGLTVFVTVHFIQVAIHIHRQNKKPKA
jgi:hypothetical protein